MTKKYKSPIKAVFLNIALPGLGLAYLGRWGYAILFFFLAPLRLLAGMIFIYAILPPWIVFGNIGRTVLTYAWWLVVMYDICTTAYELAEEYNQKISSQVSQTLEVKTSNGLLQPNSRQLGM